MEEKSYVVTSFSDFYTGEGERIHFTYSELDSMGRVISQNNKQDFIILDNEIKSIVTQLKEYITKTYLKRP